MAQPMQPLYLDSEGDPRFKQNAIVRFMYDEMVRHGWGGMNALANIPFTGEDWDQFYQLIGYSLCGFSELTGVDPETLAQAEAQAAALKPKRRKS